MLVVRRWDYKGEENPPSTSGPLRSSVKLLKLGNKRRNLNKEIIGREKVLGRKM